MPGPNAALCALVLSGMDCARFVFEGFLPVKGKERLGRLQALAAEQRTAILYESPHRLEDTIKQLAQYCPGRELALIRELTKLHEECLKITLDSNIIAFSAPKASPGENMCWCFRALWKNRHILKILKRMCWPLMASGMDKKEAVKTAAAKEEFQKTAYIKNAWNCKFSYLFSQHLSPRFH